MTELQLYKFLKQNDIEIHVYKNECLIFLDFDEIKEFLDLCKNFWDDENTNNACVKSEYIVINITEFCEYCGINIDNIANEDGLL